MPLNVTNYVLTRTILERAAGEEPTDEQKSDIGRYSAVAALAPGNLGLAIPFIARNRIVRDEGEGEGEGPVGEHPANDEVVTRLTALQESVDANTKEMETIKTDLEALRKDVDELKGAAPQGSSSRTPRNS